MGFLLYSRWVAIELFPADWRLIYPVLIICRAFIQLDGHLRADLFFVQYFGVVQWPNHRKSQHGQLAVRRQWRPDKSVSNHTGILRSFHRVIGKKSMGPEGQMVHNRGRASREVSFPAKLMEWFWFHRGGCVATLWRNIFFQWIASMSPRMFANLGRSSFRLRFWLFWVLQETLYSFLASLLL